VRVCRGYAEEKPNPAPLQLGLARLRAGPHESVYVGDTAEDVEMAKRTGVRAIGVHGPFPTEKRLIAARPDALLNSIRELPGCLRSLSTAKRLTAG
jgi:phosphoglycolate phosphatase-like HAD superfamily hydrolase